MPNTGPVELLVLLSILILVFVAIPVAIALLAIHLFRGTGRSTRARRAGAGHEADAAVEIVRARFARGEISVEDYEAALRALGRPPAS